MIGCVTALPMGTVNTTRQLCSIVNRVHYSFRYVTRSYYLNKELCSIVNRVHYSFRKSPQASSNNLFEMGDLQNKSVLTNDPLVLMCKDDKYEDLYGNELDGFSFKFCNKTSYVQTDVGLCISTDSFMHQDNGKIIKKVFETTLSDGLRNIEHLMVLSVSKFEILENSEVKSIKYMMRCHNSKFWFDNISFRHCCQGPLTEILTYKCKFKKIKVFQKFCLASIKRRKRNP